MKLKPQHCALFSVLTFAAACSDDPIAPMTTGGTGGGGAGGGGTSSGGTSAGTMSGGTSAGTTTAGAATAGTAGTSAGTGGAGGAGGGGAGGGGAGGVGGGGAPAAVCGNGMKEGAEACDDADTMATDGCSATCTIEPGYKCAVAGQACVPECGDGMKIAPEACDDDNTTAGDGCTATCTMEPGWACPTAGMPCDGICGDGILVSGELCDDENDDAADGCSAACVPETGFVCDVPGEACRKKPNCTGGICTSTCGDGLVISEACDDGNVADGDGCSALCAVEATHNCTVVAAPLPDQLAIPATYRDFIGAPMGGSTKHPDFQAFSGGNITPGMVEATLDAGGLPVYTGVCELGGPNIGMAACPFGAQSTSEANFDQWYRDTVDVNLTRPGVVILGRVGQTPDYVFDGGQTFTPLTGDGWDAEGDEALHAGTMKNFGFTTELRYFFLYQGDETLEFAGDDDVWVFINNKLAVDIGGLHPKQTKALTLGVQVSGELGLTPGNVYELALFHAERSPAESNFKLTLKGFLNNKSVCTLK